MIAKIVEEFQENGVRLFECRGTGGIFSPPPPGQQQFVTEHNALLDRAIETDEGLDKLMLDNYGGGYGTAVEQDSLLQRLDHGLDLSALW